MQCILINYTTNNNIKTKNHNALLHLFFCSHERSSYYVSCHSMVTRFLDDLEVTLREVQSSDGGQSVNEQVYRRHGSKSRFLSEFDKKCFVFQYSILNFLYKNPSLNHIHVYN